MTKRKRSRIRLQPVLPKAPHQDPTACGGGFTVFHGKPLYARPRGDFAPYRALFFVLWALPIYDSPCCSYIQIYTGAIGLQTSTAKPCSNPGQQAAISVASSKLAASINR